jgi:hypothetical protein
MLRRLVQGYRGPAPGAQALFTPDVTSRFVNPECGPYGWVYSNSNSGVGGSWLQNFTANGLAGLRSAAIPRTLVIGFIDGTTNVTSNFSTAQINAMRTALGLVRAAGMKVTLLLCYNFADSGPDATAAQIDAHLAQLQQTFLDYEDVIYVAKMGGLGAYGEFHDGSTGGAENQSTKLAVMQSFMNRFPPAVHVLSRYPADAMTWFPTVITQSQFLASLTTPTNQSRLGNFDDGWASNDSNSGTFDNRPGTASTTGNIAAKQAYSKAQSLYTPAMGEVTTYADTDPTHWRTSYAAATSEGAAFHMGALNFEYNSGPGFWDAYAVNGADQQIAKYYGYRIQLDAVRYPISASLASSSTISVDLRNNGYSRIHRKRFLRVTLRHATTGETYSATAEDLRRLDPNATSSTTVAGSIFIPSTATPGNYALLLSAPDNYATLAGDARFAVRFANANSGAQAWDAANARFNTGVTIAVA